LAWRIEFDPRARDDLARLDREVQRRILRFLRERVAVLDDPRQLGDALTGKLKGLWKYRVGDYRIIARLEDAAVRVLVARIGHRRQIYRQ
jgi:mRNA interferase RelE/StbE